MKILFISGDQKANYLRETIFHGLVSLGHEVIDIPSMWFMYSNITAEQQYNLYGHGMTIFGTLDNKDVDRQNIQEKILDHHFDLVVYGRANELAFKDEVKQVYSKNEVVLLVGGDKPKKSSDFENLKSFGKIFIREMIDDNDKNAFPIQYSIPEEKILHYIPKNKNTIIAPLVPGDKKTYIYKDEKSYYSQYQTSYFGLTMKKGGWDCLRHYEIVANGCLPLFKNFNDLPKLTMVKWPRTLQNDVINLYKNRQSNGLKAYEHTCEVFMNYLKTNLTTKCMAKYLLERMQ